VAWIGLAGLLLLVSLAAIGYWLLSSFLMLD
jgi:hypothetical protein